MVSRRSIIAGGISSGAVLALSSASGLGASPNKKGHNKRHDVSDFIAVTPASDPSFTEKLKDHFPGLIDDPVFQKIQSHAVLVTNVGGKKIRAYSTRWKISTQGGGTYETTLRHYFHPSAKKHKTSKFGTGGNKTKFTGRMPAMKKNATRLVTPYFNWSSRHYKRNRKPNWQKILGAKMSRQFFLYELSRAQTIDVTIDAVIINRCTVIGPNVSHLARYYSITRNAEHDEALGIQSLLAKGASINEIAMHLQMHATSTLPSRKAPLHRLYNAVRRRQAHILLKQLRRGGEQKFLKMLKYMAKQRKTVIKHRQVA